MAAGAALPGLFFCFAATVLLVVVTVSSPVWESVSFLDVTTGGKATKFGVFGYTGSKVAVGYTFAPAQLGFNDTKLNTGVIHSLTSVLVLYPVAAGLAGLSVFFGLCGAMYHRAGTVFMSLLSALATICVLIAWVISMALFSIARNRIRSDIRTATAQYGNANWIALGALVALLIGFCTATCGVFGHYRRHRSLY